MSVYATGMALNKDPLLDELKRFPRLNWSGPARFVGRVDSLLESRAVEEQAGGASDVPSRVAALRRVFEAVAQRIRSREEAEPGGTRRPKSIAVEWLFRLNDDAAGLNVDEIHDKIVRAWQQDHGPLSVSGFRRHLLPEVYEEALLEFRALSGDLAPASFTDLEARALDQSAFYLTLTHAIERAHKRIDLTHHEGLSPSLTGITAKGNYFKKIEQKTRGTELPIRRIVSIPTLEKLEWVESEHLERLGKCANYHLRYTPLGGSVPNPLSLQIVDEQECFIINISAGAHTESGMDLDFWIKSPAVASYFARYYEVYWNSCFPLKEGRKLYSENLEAIRNALKSGTGSPPPLGGHR